MAAGLFEPIQFFDNNGDPLNGGLVYTYEPGVGVTAPKQSYQDAALTVAHANPVVLSAFGRPPAPIWMSGETKIVITTSTGTVLATLDNLNRDPAGSSGWATKGEGVLTKSAPYTLAEADDGKTVVATSGSWTLDALAAATLGDGYVVDFVNLGAGVVTFDPAGSETANGAATMSFGPGDGARLVCDGSNWRALQIRNEVRDGMKNRVINGDVRIDQRNAGVALTVNGTGAFYGPDMWRAFGASADGVFTIARSTSSPPAGFTHFLRATVTTADASIGASQRYCVGTVFEGSNMFDLGFGAAGAKTVTVSFLVRSSLTGNFSGVLSNAAGTRVYPFIFAINSANTWERKSVTIEGDVSGTWPTDVNAWGSLFFDLGAGSSLRSAAGAWTATANVIGATGAVSLIGTLSATFDITGVQLEQGGAATEFERPSVTESMQRCMRYYQRMVTGEAAERQTAPYFQMYTTYGTATTGMLGEGSLAVPMRTAPTATRIGNWALSNVTGQPIIGGANPCGVQASGNTITITGSAQATPNAGSGYDLSAEL